MPALVQCKQSKQSKPDVPPELREALAFFFALMSNTAVVSVDDFLLEAMAVNKAIRQQKEFQTSRRSQNILRIYTTITSSTSTTSQAQVPSQTLFAVLTILKFAVITYTVTRELLMCGGDEACFYTRLQSVVHRSKAPMFPNIAWFLRHVMTFMGRSERREAMFGVELDSVDRILQTTAAHVAATQPVKPVQMTAEHVGVWILSAMRGSFSGPQSYYTKIEKPLMDIL